MKIILSIFGIILILFVISQLFFLNSQRNIETYAFTIIDSYETIEIRQYQASLFTSVQMPSNNYRKTSSKGFSVLAGYIFGGNDKEEKIAMTSPVAMSLKDSTTMLFLVPKKYTRDNLPVPNDSSIEFKDIPEKRVAAISFGGWANDSKIASFRSKLITALNNKGIEYTDNFYFLGYNAPMEVFNRKNEIIVELK
ncbi:heme-binding protein [Flavobacteriaceae bacterium]|nr:heme-binding protein [Flavobacteriaceae bacterium]MDC0870987.1 heme-binding protein [Flavobacteriaceae bacterium]